MAAGMLAMALACQPATTSPGPSAPATLAGKRLLDQDVIMAGSQGWGCWPAAVVATPDGCWFSARAPGRLYRVTNDAFIGSSAVDQDVGLEGITRIGDVEYVVDTDRQMVLAFRRGEAARTVTRAAVMTGTDPLPESAPDGTPTAEAKLDTPLAVAATPDGALLVTETARGRVRRLVLGGTIGTVLDGLETPTSLAVGPDGSVVVVEAGAGRIVRWQAGTGKTVIAADLTAPDGVAVTADGTVWVSGTGVGTLLALRPDGRREPYLVPGMQAPGPLAVDGSALLILDRGDSSLWRTAPVPLTTGTSN